MISFENYHAANGRCLVNWQTFQGFEMARSDVLAQLKDRLGFVPVKVDMIEEARRLVGSGEFERRAEESLAPKVIYMAGNPGWRRPVCRTKQISK